MSHSSILFQEYTINISVNLTTFVVTSVTTTLLATRIDVVSTLFLGVFCLCDTSVDFTRLQHKIILKKAGGPICFQVIMFNVYFWFWWGQLCLSTRRADKNSLSWWGPCCRCRPDRRCGVSSISIESDQPVSNVLLERNNSNTNIDCSNKFDKHDSLYTIWTGSCFIKDK
jgi:hypothetical protein